MDRATPTTPIDTNITRTPRRRARGPTSETAIEAASGTPSQRIASNVIGGRSTAQRIDTQVSKRES
jgi:hypothetical protein